MKMLKYISLFCFLLCFTACKKDIKKETIQELPYFNSASFTPEWGIAKHKIKDFTFYNQNGKTITNKTFNDKIYIADFFFTSCPGICPKLAKGMYALQEWYKQDPDIMFLSHTVMPWKDSIPVLKRYAITNKVNVKKWHLVTGKKDDLYDIARTSYFADEDFNKTQTNSEFIHTENFILVDKKGYIRGVYNGTLSFDLERLKRHIAILKTEKGT